MANIKGHFWYFAYGASFVGCLGWNRVVDIDMLTIGPASCILLISPLSASEWLVTGMHKPVLKTTLNVCFQKYVTQWCSLMFQIKYCVLFGILKIPLKRKLNRKQKGGLFTFGCSLFARFSVSTVGLELIRYLIWNIALSTRWVAHFWKQTFRVDLRTGLWMPVASHSEADRGDSKWAQYQRQDR